MKKLVLFFFLSLLSCNIGFAKINDVYYCEMNKFSKTNDKVVVEWKLEKFKFKREQNVIKFSSGGFFNDTELVVKKNVNIEYFYGGSDFVIFIYTNGKFVLSNILNIMKDDGSRRNQAINVIATCDVF